MGKFNLYKIPLKSLAPGTYSYEYELDDRFFENIDEGDIRKGGVHAAVTVCNRGEVYALDFDLQGMIQIPCDRCLDNMDLEVSVQEHLYVKWGSSYSEESDDTVIVPESEGEINLAWFLYEFIALSIPLKHVHPAGMCNKAVTAKLYKHSARRADDEEEESVFGDEADYSDDSRSEIPNDPRWDALRNIDMDDNNN